MAGENPDLPGDAGRDRGRSGNGSGHNSASGSGNGTRPPPRTFLERMSRTFLNPPKPKTKPAPVDEAPARELTDEEKRVQITRIDPTERKLGYAAAILASVVSLITFAPFINNPALTVQKTASPIRGHTCQHLYRYGKVGGHFTCVADVRYSRSHWVTELVILLIFALAVVVATRLRRRAALAFTTLMTGLAMLSVVQSVLAFPFIFLGGWLMVRAWRVQRYGSPTAKSRAGGGSAGSGTTRGWSGATGGGRGRSTRPATRADARSGRRARSKAPSGPVRPAPSKRYTPKAPPRRRIPPAE
jgi:hypothetical protein